MHANAVCGTYKIHTHGTFAHSVYIYNRTITAFWHSAIGKLNALIVYTANTCHFSALELLFCRADHACCEHYLAINNYIKMNTTIYMCMNAV